MAATINQAKYPQVWEAIDAIEDPTTILLLNRMVSNCSLNICP